MADTLDDIAHDEYLTHCGTNEALYHELSRSLFEWVISCERSCADLLAKSFCSDDHAAQAMVQIFFKKRALTPLVEYAREAIKNGLQEAFPQDLFDPLKSVGQFRNDLAHDQPNFDADTGTLELTTWASASSLYSLDEIQAFCQKAEDCARSLDYHRRNNGAGTARTPEGPFSVP